MAEFFEQCFDWACTLTAKEDAGHFGFGCGCDDIFDGGAHDVDGSVVFDCCCRFVSKNKPSGGS